MVKLAYDTMQELQSLKTGMGPFQQPVLESGDFLHGTVHGSPCIQSGLNKRLIEPQDVFSGQHGVANGCSRNSVIPLLSDSQAVFSSGARLSLQSSRLDSPVPSTSGRGTTNSTIMPVLSREVQTLLIKQNADIEREIEVQGQKMRQGLEKKAVDHMRAIILAMEAGLKKRVRCKEKELEIAWSKNGELEMRVKELEQEARLWQEFARKNYLLAWNLRHKLETAEMVIQAKKQIKEEGCGETQDPGDCASSCHLKEQQNQGIDEGQLHQNHPNQYDLQQYLNCKPSCRLCGTNHVCILILPCRHLCLCKACEGLLDYCPLCQVMKSASIQVFLS